MFSSKKILFSNKPTSAVTTTTAPTIPCASISPIDVFDTISLGVTYSVSDYWPRKLNMFQKIAMNQSGSVILFRSKSLEYNAQPPTWTDYCDAQSLSIVESGVPRSLKGPDGEPLHDQPPDPNAIYGNNRDGIERIDIYQNCSGQYRYPNFSHGDYIEDLQMFHINGYDIITFTEQLDHAGINNRWQKQYRWRRNGAEPDPTSTSCDPPWNCGNNINTQINYKLYPHTNHVVSRSGKVVFLTIWDEDTSNSYNQEPEILIKKLKEDEENTIIYTQPVQIKNKIIFGTKDKIGYDTPFAPMSTNEDGTVLLTTNNFSQTNKSLDIVVYSGEYTPSTLGYGEEIDFTQLGNAITVPDEALKWTSPFGFGGSVPGAQSSIQAVINGIGNVLCVFRDEGYTEYSLDDWKVKSTILEIYKYKEDVSDWEKVFSHTKELSSIREIRINNEGNIVAVATNTSLNEVEVYFSDNSKENWRKVFSKTGVMESQGFASSIAMNDDGSLLSIASDPYIRGGCYDGCDWPLTNGSIMEVYNLSDIDC